MPFPHPNLVTFLVFLLAGLILVQAVVLAVIMRRLFKMTRQIDHHLETLTHTSKQVFDLTARAVAILEKTSLQLQDFERFTEESLSTVRTFASKADQAVAKQLDMLRSQMVKASEATDTILGQFSQQTFRVHQAILQPSMRPSALIRAGIVSLKRALSREDGGRPTSGYPDQEIFI